MSLGFGASPLAALLVPFVWSVWFCCVCAPGMAILERRDAEPAQRVGERGIHYAARRVWAIHAAAGSFYRGALGNAAGAVLWLYRPKKRGERR